MDLTGATAETDSRICHFFPCILSAPAQRQSRQSGVWSSSASFLCRYSLGQLQKKKKMTTTNNQNASICQIQEKQTAFCHDNKSLKFIKHVSVINRSLLMHWHGCFARTRQGLIRMQCYKHMLILVRSKHLGKII